jgi:hypothetical protein
LTLNDHLLDGLNMANDLHQQPQVSATVVEVLPSVGLAYLEGDDARSWAVTKSTRGAGLHTLHPGRRVALTVQHHSDFSIVSGYAPLD